MQRISALTIAAAPATSQSLLEATQKKIVQEVYERPVCVGDILIQQGDVGAAASQLYIVKHGKFEVGGCVWQPAPSNTHSVVSTM